jgi:HPt (histidine-containing phosphotransfer) domain-containing protein
MQAVYDGVVDTAEPFEERMRHLREGYIASLPARLETMRLALRGEDRATLQQEAHRLAGTGQSYGLPQLTTWGREVERKCKAGAALEAIVVDLDALSRMLLEIVPLDGTGS